MYHRFTVVKYQKYIFFLSVHKRLNFHTKVLVIYRRVSLRYSRHILDAYTAIRGRDGEGEETRKAG